MPQNCEIAYSLEMTAAPCMAGCITSIRPTYSCTRAVTYLLTYTVGSGRTKVGNISYKRLKIERKLYSLYKVVHWLVWLSIAAKMYDLE